MANTVESVKAGEPWGDDPPMVTYDLKVSGHDGTVYRYLPESVSEDKKPKIGDVGSVDTSGKKPKFVPGGGQTGWAVENGSRTDATGKSIERQVAAKAAAEMTAVIGGPAPEMVQNFNGLFDAVLSRIQDIGGGGASSGTGTPDEPGIASTAAPSDALSPQRAKALEQSIAAAGMTKDEVRILLGATGVAVGDDLYQAIASMTPAQASSIESFVETKQQMAAA